VSIVLGEMSDDILRQVILACIIKKRYCEIDLIRELSKRPEMRTIWSLCKSTNQPVFPGFIYEWNALQKRLVFWFNYYSSIEGAYNRPPSWVLKNNELVDKWMKRLVEDSEQESEQNWRKGKVDVPRTPYDHDEVYEIDSW
jgi:hypothetical protein